MKSTLLIYMICFLILVFVSNTMAQKNDSLETEFEPLPIFYYDTNDGFGYGIKAFLINFLQKQESFDILLTRSTKGFRKYTLIFSTPDFELRQGTIYPLALDLKLDYKKWIAYKFYGIGNASKFKDEELFSREHPLISLTLSRGFTKKIIGEIGLNYQSSRNYEFKEDGKLQYCQDLCISRVYYYSIFLSARYDTRNSFIHPSDGIVIQGENEYANGNVTFNHWSMWFQQYTALFKSTIILASRLGIQSLSGDNLPIQVLLPIGGDDTIRGFSQDRFLDKTSAVINIELRFPFFWRFGGIIGFDTGKVWNKLKQFGFKNWPYNLTIGGRFYFDTFVVRGDLGLSKETVGIYLNFAHIF